MDGPQFLVFYFLIEVLLITLGYRAINKIAEGTKRSSGFETSPEALPVAYLSGGIHQLIYTILFRLHILTAIEYKKSSNKFSVGKISRKNIADENERILFDLIKKNGTPHGLHTDIIARVLKDQIEKHFFFVNNPGLLFNGAEKSLWIRRIVLTLIFSIAAIRIIYGLTIGMNRFMFLIILCLIGLFIAFAYLRPPVTSKSATDYLLHLKTLNPKPSQTIFDVSSNQQKALYIALYGESMLEYLGWKSVCTDYLGTEIKKTTAYTRKRSRRSFSYSQDSSTSSSDSGWDDSTSSSTSNCSGGDSSSCGGGCGGCGGGD